MFGLFYYKIYESVRNMKVELKSIDNNNREECIALKVADGQTQYICSNLDSLNDAEENVNVARPFAIYVEDKMVGFTMFAFDEEYENPNDRYWLWRFMIDKDLQGNGYGYFALDKIINYFKTNGANNIRLSTKSSNINALSLYHKFGFKETGEMNGEEIVLELDF